MADYVDGQLKRYQWSEAGAGQQLTSDDLNGAIDLVSENVLEILRGVFGTTLEDWVDCVIHGYESVIHATSFAVTVGDGVALMSAGGTPIDVKLLWSQADQNLTITNNVSGSLRYDIVEIKYQMSDADQLSRNFKDPTTKVISAAATYTTMNNNPIVQLTAGTPGAGVPATTAGYMKILEVTVPTGSTDRATWIAAGGAITEARQMPRKLKQMRFSAAANMIAFPGADNWYNDGGGRVFGVNGGGVAGGVNFPIQFPVGSIINSVTVRGFAAVAATMTVTFYSVNDAVPTAIANNTWANETATKVVYSGTYAVTDGGDQLYLEASTAAGACYVYYYEIEYYEPLTSLL